MSSFSPAKCPASSPPAHIPDSDRIPFFQKLVFSAGITTETMGMGLLTSVLWMPYFNIGLGINPTLLGTVLGILFAWNSFAGPIMGSISDNARTRWGRRRPFIAAGSLLLGCFYPLFFYMPTGMSDTGKIIYLSVLGIAFFSCNTIWSSPYYGLQMELTPNYDERTRLSSWMAVFGKLSGLACGWVLALATSRWFINPATGKGDILIGMKTLCWFIAGLIILFGLLTAFFVKERYYQAESSHQLREPFWRSVKDSAQCKPLWFLIGVSFFMIFGSVVVGTLAQYLNIYYIFDGDLAAASIIVGWKSTVLVITGILLIPVWMWIGEKYDKKTVLLGMISFTMIGHLTNYFLMRPNMPYLQIIPSMFESAAISAVWLFIPSMKADTADYDEIHTARRREGSINAFFSCFVGASTTCATGLGGLILELSGFTSKITHQPPEVLKRMLHMFLILPIGIWAIAIAIGWFYPLSRRRMREIRAELENRRGVV